jgi:hypothetical protein
MDTGIIVAVAIYVAGYLASAAFYARHYVDATDGWRCAAAWPFVWLYAIGAWLGARHD